MNILYLHQYFVTPFTGGATRSYELGRRLVGFGHEVNVVTSDQTGGGGGLWRQSFENGIKVHWANVKYDNAMSFPRRIAAFLSFSILATWQSLRTKADVIYATSTPLTIAIPALMASTLKRIPFVFEVRDIWPDVPIAIGALRNPVLIWAAQGLESITYKRAAHIVVLSPSMKDSLVAKGVPENKVTVITQGCGVALLSETVGIESPRTEFPWLGARKLVLYGGALGAANGVDYMLRLAVEVRKVAPDIRFVIIGGGKQQAAIANEAKLLGVLNDSLFILNAMPKASLARWMVAADMHLALFTGPRDVWKDIAQNKLFDAIAAGKPIANNFDGWQAHFTEKEGIGIFLDPQDTKSAAARLVKALHDEAWLDSVATKDRLLAEGPFHWQNLAQILKERLEAAAAKRGRVD